MDNNTKLPYVSSLMHELADLFETRNLVYKDNFRRVGEVMVGLFPEGPPTLKTADDYNRWHLFELAIVKLTRYAVAYDNGGHKDSIDDMIVYFGMVAALDAEERDRKESPLKARLRELAERACTEQDPSVSSSRSSDEDNA